MTWTALLEETKLSRGALSKHLNRLIERKIVLTKTLDNRPPRTMYYLAKQPIMNLLLFLTEGRSQEEIKDLFDNILSETVLAILVQAHEQIISSFHVKIPLKGFISADEDGKLLDDLQNRPIKFGLFNALADVDFDNMTDAEKNTFLGKEFSHISVQFILGIYEIERKILEVLPNKVGDFGPFFLLSLIQERHAWEEINRFSTWWRQEIAPKIPSSALLAILAMYYASMNISSQQ